MATSVLHPSLQSLEYVVRSDAIGLPFQTSWQTGYTDVPQAVHNAQIQVGVRT